MGSAASPLGNLCGNSLMWAEVLELDIAWADAWLPLAIGVTVGGLCILVARQFAPRRREREMVPPPDRTLYYDPFEKGSATEKRSMPRRSGNPTEIFYAQPDKKDNPIRAWVLDRSVAGICLWLGESLANGTILSILPINAAPLTPWIDVEVCNCRPHSGAFEVGCKFLKSPPSLILMQFG
jgi:hypothetical protein